VLKQDNLADKRLFENHIIEHPETHKDHNRCLKHGISEAVTDNNIKEAHAQQVWEHKDLADE